jgi:hypothetical protein
VSHLRRFCGASHDGVDLFWLSLGFLKILIVTPQIGPTIPTGCRALTSTNNLSPKPEAGKSAKIRRVEGKIIPGNYFGYVRF